ncbi:MAG TPA: hypothetical protein PKX17_03780 [Candidatus Methanomethylicus sp.]|nr:hypothetical protein [Candidatus Methanomethylicus sp.]
MANRCVFRCPVRGCGFASTTFSGVKRHYGNNHVSDVCPVCGRRMLDISTHEWDYCVISRYSNGGGK